MCKVYLKPPQELKLPAYMLLKVLRPLYRLPGSLDYWKRKNTTNWKHEQGMNAAEKTYNYLWRTINQNILLPTHVFWKYHFYVRTLSCIPTGLCSQTENISLSELPEAHVHLKSTFALKFLPFVNYTKATKFLVLCIT